MLNEKIRELRKAHGFSQVELAKRIGVTKQCVCNWENDNIQPSIEMLMKLASVFAVTTDELLGLQRETVLDVSGLSPEQIAHIRFLIEDLKNTQSR